MGAPSTVKRTVKFKLDAKKPLSAKQRKRLKTVASISDSKIDYSDIPRRINAALREYVSVHRKVG